MDVASTDAGKAPTKGGSEEEATQGRSWADRFFKVKQTNEVE